MQLVSWEVEIAVLWPGSAGDASEACGGGVSPAAVHDLIPWSVLCARLGLCPTSVVESPFSTLPGVRVSGAVLLLGIGGYLCWRLLAVWMRGRWARAPATDPSLSGRPIPPQPPAAIRFSGSSGAAEDHLSLQTHYFGPLNLNNDESCLDATSTEVDRQDLLNYTPQKSVGRRRLPYRDRPQLRRRPALDSSMHSLQSGSSSGGTGGSSPRPRRSSLGRSRCRDASFDSASSEISMSFDMPSFADQEPEAVARLDRLQEEIDRLKDSCRLMDDDLETVKCTRNLPGLAELLSRDGDTHCPPPSNAARACFTGLYSLTCVNRSMSLDLSLEDDSFPSLEWDDEECAATALATADTDSYPDQPAHRPPVAVGSPRHISACIAGASCNGTSLLKQGCEEAERSLQYRWVRRVRPDEHCAVRCALFQCLARGLTIPRGTDTLACLARYKPAAAWKFSGLRYPGTNTFHVMEICLRALDDVSTASAAEGGGGERAVAALLNADPSLDLRLVNALRLHMLAYALRLGQADQLAPLFATDLGHPPHHERPDSMNNWIVDVADTAAREQMELTLLGGSLQATVRVVRLSAHGTDRFISDYPDDRPSWPRVVLLSVSDEYLALSE